MLMGMTTTPAQVASPAGLPSDVREAFRAAVLGTWNSERELFTDQTHERTIMGHVGHRLALVLASWAETWSIDLEYNRQHAKATGSSPHAWQPKRIDKDGQPEDILPDLIVHRRGQSSAGRNLLAVEAKLVPRGRQQEDILKLVRLVTQHHYQNAAYVRFYPVRPPRWHWIAEAGERLHSCSQHAQCPLENV